MKRILVFTACLILGTGAASANPCLIAVAAGSPGSIGLFADVDATDCNIVNLGGGLITIHMIHVHHDGATAAMFKIVDGGTGWFPGAYTKPTAMTTIGAPLDGISIGYGVPCATAPTYLGEQAFFAAAAAPDCTYLSVVPHPEALTGKIEGVDCAQTKTFPTGGQAIVNPTVDCDCGGCPPPPPNPVESTTWGAIKAMYR
jgi:hypothetical protein